MNFAELHRLLAAERRGEISPEDEARLQAALSADADLAAEERRERALSALIRADREALAAAAPPDLAARVLAGTRVLRARTAASPFGLAPMHRLLRPVAAAAALLLMVAAGFWAGRTTTRADVSKSESDLAEKVRETVQREGLDREAADRLLETFRAERARLDAEHEAALGRIVAELELGMQRLAQRRER